MALVSHETENVVSAAVSVTAVTEKKWFRSVSVLRKSWHGAASVI